MAVYLFYCRKRPGAFNVPGPDQVWEIQEEGETWGQCDFLIESNEYSASAQRTIASMRNAKDLWFRSRIGKGSYGEKSGPRAFPCYKSQMWERSWPRSTSAKHLKARFSWKIYYEKLCSAKRVYAMVVADEYRLERLHEMFVEIKKEEAEGRDAWDTI